MRDTKGQKLGIVVTPNTGDSNLNIKALTSAFGELWSAARHYQEFVTGANQDTSDPTRFNSKARADLVGQAVQFAEMLAWSQPYMLLTPSVSLPDIARQGVSARSIISLVSHQWTTSLPEIAPEDDETWDLFLKAVQAIELGDNPSDQINQLAERRWNSDVWKRYATYYATAVVPDWRLWLQGINDDDFKLPRI